MQLVLNASVSTILALLCSGILSLLTLLVLYQWLLAIVAILSSEPRNAKPRKAAGGDRQQRKFTVLIPAHNEEISLPSTLQSLMEAKYPQELISIVVIADRCSDATSVVARNHGVMCLERRNGPPGKGAAIAWAIEELRSDHAVFDALIVLDADTTIDAGLFEAFNEGLLAGHAVQQAYNYLSNPWQSPFTRLIAVTSVLRNSFFYGGKNHIGLSGMLTGTGMCFSRRIVEEHRWTAFSVGEDWEFSASLLLNSVKIYFNQSARVLAKESCNFRQASSQRLRWASGRYAVAANTAWKLFAAGVRLRRPYLVDAAATLVNPHYSTQAALAVVAVAGAWLLSRQSEWHPLLVWSVLVFGALTAYLLLGVISTEAPVRTLLGIFLIPMFLPWRITIEVLGVLGYGRGYWVRTPRQ
jgi:cellulose synthase/poly-beta-1,6-N-acetylglucosamine synthase-like glycosyltransferase